MVRFLYKAASFTTLVAVILISLTGIASASYHAERLIDNLPFLNNNSMSQTAIQNFLNDRNSGLKNLSYYEVCSDSYMTSHYPRCGQYLPVSSLIRDAANAYGLSPRVILATLQKEQSLITDPSPSSSQRNCAMGYRSCDSSYLGFFTQVDWGTYQLRLNYARASGDNSWTTVGSPPAYLCDGRDTSLYSTGLFPGRTVTFNNPGGSARTITLANAATASLYCYTPYVGPYSETGYSGSYNFVVSWESWWGSTWADAVRLTVYDYVANENGGHATVGLSLGSQPTDNVTIPLSVSDSTEATLGGTGSITITPANWNSPANNKVIITGVDDNIPDGRVTFRLLTGQPTSTDYTYSSLSATDTPDVDLYNADNDIIPFGSSSDVPLVGDWNGDGKTDLGIKRGNHYYLTTDRFASWYKDFTYGSSDSIPLVGDWDGNGTDTISLRIGSKIFISNSFNGVSALRYIYGNGSETPIVGDWNHDSTDTVGLKVGYKYFINNGFDSFSDSAFSYGTGSEVPIAGDWNNDNSDTVSLKTGYKIFINNGLDRYSDSAFSFRQPSYTPLGGHWNGAGADTFGARVGNLFYLNIGP